MVKILNHHIKGNMIVVETDNIDRPTFVYFADKFSSLKELEAEIDKSINLQKKRSQSKSLKIQKLEEELNARN